MIRPHDIQALHSKGVRPLLEFLTEIEAEIGEESIAALLRTYIRIDDVALDALNGRDIPRPVLHEVAA